MNPSAAASTLACLPFAIGGLHAMVALNSLGSVLLVNVVGYSVVVVALFALIQFGFFALTSWTYLRALVVRQ
ncbi:MAG TPA: hypothetical protein VFD39_07005 [Trueperaceae bacterium]|nr:hypothetical protein [Trueperaceae bacterium]